MLPVHPQYLKDSDGNNSFVVLTFDEFEAIVEKLEDLEDVRLYDEAKEKTMANEFLWRTLLG